MKAMKPIVVIYATRAGHTHRIAAHVADRLRAADAAVQVIDAAHSPNEFLYGQLLRL